LTLGFESVSMWSISICLVDPFLQEKEDIKLIIKDRMVEHGNKPIRTFVATRGNNQ